MAESHHVALACCRASPDAEPADLYPDPDSELLADRLRALGIAAQLVSWDDDNLDWGRFDSVVLRSTWDGIDRPGQYLTWVRHVETCTTLQNPAAVVEWNINKTYLRDLAEAGVPTIPTQWIAPGDSWEDERALADDFIVKPAIGSGARNTARYSASAVPAAQQHIEALGAIGQTVLIQKYFPSVEHAGETSIMFIDGRPSHAVRKGAFLNADEGVLDKPWERMTHLGPCEPTATQMDIATHAFTAAQQHCVEQLLYGRVDLIDDPSGSPVVIEVELIDPALSLRHVPEAADRLAATIERRL